MLTKLFYLLRRLWRKSPLYSGTIDRTSLRSTPFLEVNEHILWKNRHLFLVRSFLVSLSVMSLGLIFLWGLGLSLRLLVVAVGVWSVVRLIEIIRLSHKIAQWKR